MVYSPMELAQAFIKSGELPDALEALNTHLEQNPDDDEGLRLRSEVLSRFRDNVSIQKALNDLIQLHTPSFDDWVRRVALSQKLGDHRSAGYALKQALSLRPGDERLTEQQVFLMRDQGQYDDALKVIDTMPHNWRWASHAADIHLCRGSYDEAIHTYTKALKLLSDASPDGHTTDAKANWAAPFEADLYLRRARAWIFLENYDKAEADYQDAAKRIPDDPMIPFKMGIIALLRGDTEQGEKLCREASMSAPVAIKALMISELQERGFGDQFLNPENSDNI